MNTNLKYYERYLIVDLEATCCDKGSIKRGEMEIIEIGAVMVDKSAFNILDEFQIFIKPVRNPVLTSFCKELTSITQQQVDKSLYFPEAIKGFKNWLYQFNNFAFCSWGDYDKNQIEIDCLFHNQTNPINASHFNIKKEFSITQDLKKKLGMAQALKHVSLSLDGTHHRGIDDARNMAKLMPYIVK